MTGSAGDETFPFDASMDEVYGTKTASEGMTAEVYLYDTKLIVPWGRLGRWLSKRLLRGLDFSVHIYTEATGWHTVLVNVGYGTLRFIKRGDNDGKNS